MAPHRRTVNLYASLALLAGIIAVIVGPWWLRTGLVQLVLWCLVGAIIVGLSLWGQAHD